MINRTESALIAQERRNQASKNRRPPNSQPPKAEQPTKTPARTTH